MWFSVYVDSNRYVISDSLSQFMDVLPGSIACDCQLDLIQTEIDIRLTRCYGRFSDRVGGELVSASSDIYHLFL